MKESFSISEQELAKKIIFESKPWSLNKIDEAATGWANGACDDPWEVELKMLVELKRLGVGLDCGVFLEYCNQLHDKISGGKEVLFSARNADEFEFNKHIWFGGE